MTAAQSHQSLLETCIQACLDCLRECENCANACLSEDMVQMMAECIKRCRDCGDTCDLCARFMSRDSALYGQMCSVCAEACVSEAPP
nr:four-helix bundle copper-binding protein [Chroococcidiopsis sp. [FACHB-1243]]